MPHPVYVDPDMWEKIVLNLLSNAFKFTFEGEIAVETRSRPPDGSHAQVTVSDTGIWHPGGRVAAHVRAVSPGRERRRGRSIEGSEVGLALVQELVRTPHGGTIRVRSVASEGSAFTVSIPFSTDHLTADQLGAAPSVPVSPPWQVSPTGRVSPNGVPSAGHAYVEEGSWDGCPTATRMDEIRLRTVALTDDVGDIAAVSGARDRSILLADDNADMRSYLERLRADGISGCEAVTDGEQALAAAGKSNQTWCFPMS